MTARGQQALSGGILTLLFALEGEEVPDAVSRVAQAIGLACVANRPVVSLNRRMGQIKRQAGPDIFTQVYIWLRTPEIEAKASAAGAYWSLRIWQDAILKIYHGKKAHVAFGMVSGGRPHSMNFGPNQDAAFLAEFRSQFVRSETATTSVLDLRGHPDLDRREIQRHRKTIRKMDISRSEIAKQAICVRMKYHKGSARPKEGGFTRRPD